MEYSVNKNKLISVYITTHNRSNKLVRAVDSVLKQTYKNFEIIISDDGSTDDTKEVCEEFLKFKHVKYIRNEIPMGANVARNNAIRIAEGEFITGLDDDDEFKEDRLEIFINNWDDRFAYICDNPINIYNNESIPDFKQKKSKIKINIRDMLLRNHASNQIFTRLDRLRFINGFNESLKRFQDWDCWIRLNKEFGIAVRLNRGSYVFHHDEAIRVSNNLKYEDAFIMQVINHREVYDTELGAKFVNRYLLKKDKICYMDLFKCKNGDEIKCVLRASRFLRSIKNFIKKNRSNVAC